MDDSIDSTGDSLSARRRQFRMGRSISMATVQAQVSLAQSLRSLFQAARDPGTSQMDGNGGNSSVEDIWLQAVYNAVVFSMVGIFLCILIAVYFVLEPFLHPILWAVLTGIFLFPFKRASTKRIEDWLKYMDKQRLPLAIGVFIPPVYSIYLLVTRVEKIILGYWKLISFLIVLTFFCYLSLHVDVFGVAYRLMCVTFDSFYQVDLMLTYTKHLQVLVIILGLPLLLWYTNNYSQHHHSPPLALQSLVVVLWYLILVNITTLCLGAMSVPMVTVLFMAAGLGYLIQLRKNSRKLEGDEEEGGREEEEELSSSDKQYRRRSVFVDAYSMIQESIVRPGMDLLGEDTSNIYESSCEGIESSDEKGREEEEGEKEEEEVSSVHVQSKGDEDDGHIVRKPTVRFKSQSFEPSHHSELIAKQSPTRPLSLDVPLSNPNTKEEREGERLSISSSTSLNQPQTANNQIFLVLITSCTVLVLIRHSWLLLLTVPLAIGWCVKRLLHLSITSYLYSLMDVYIQRLKEWSYRHQPKLFPQPIPTLLQLCLDIDNLALLLLKNAAGSVVSTLIIIGLLLGSVGLSAFLVFQIQLEISHTVGLATQVLNTSLDDSHWIQSVLGQKDTVHSHLEQFADQGFHYGREWLADQIHGIVTDSTTRTQILTLYDKMYHAYVFQNSSDKEAVLVDSNVDPSQLNFNNIRIWDQAKSFLSENLETILSIIQSLWSLLSANVSLVFTLVTSFFSIVFSGGTLLLNFVVFITTLFYLLCYSDDIYLPIKWILNALPSIVSGGADSKNYADVFMRVIRSVFIASLRRACFYGLYTWLILSIFGMKIIILPSALAALVGAIPFVGPYWVGVPCILQLWLVEGSLFQALVVLGLFLFPSFIIDSLINSEIEGSHPYLTGLAIAGGVYFSGLEGAIFGPILLCVLLFLVNLLTEMHDTTL